MDVLGGCSKEVEKDIKELVGDKCESIMHQMQKAIHLVHYTLLECSTEHLDIYRNFGHLF